MITAPAVQAGTPDPETKEEFADTVVEDIPFHIRKSMLDKNYVIDWLGFWIIGQFVVREAQ